MTILAAHMISKSNILYTFTNRLSLIFIILGFFYTCPVHAQGGGRTVSEKLLAKSDQDSVIDQATVFSADGRRVAYRINAGGKQSVVVDGTPNKPYDAISPPSFSADSRS